MKKIFIIAAIVVVLICAGWWIRDIFDKGPEAGGARSQNYSGGKETDLQERKLVALGSSLSKANNLSSKLAGDNPEYSFSTGSEIGSLYSYLKKNDDNLTAVNLAESGADSEDVLQRQVPNALGYYPKYVTLDPTADVLIGGTLEEYERNLSEIIFKIQGEDTVVFVSNYPDLIKMRTASYQACKEDRLGVGIDRLSSEKIIAYNKVIEDVAKQHNAIFVDIYGALGPEDVSDHDCLHPNISGQKKIADKFIRSFELMNPPQGYGEVR